MSARVLRLPETEAGRAQLRSCVELAGGWDFPDGSRAEDCDFDQGALMVEEYLADIDEVERGLRRYQTRRRRRGMVAAVVRASVKFSHKPTANPR